MGKPTSGSEPFTNLRDFESDDDGSRKDESGSSESSSARSGAADLNTPTTEGQPLLSGAANRGLDETNVVVNIGNPSSNPLNVRTASTLSIAVGQQSTIPPAPPINLKSVKRTNKRPHGGEENQPSPSVPESVPGSPRSIASGDDSRNSVDGDNDSSLDDSSVILLIPEPTLGSNVTVGKSSAEGSLPLGQASIPSQLSHKVSLRQQPELAPLSRRSAAADNQRQAATLKPTRSKRPLLEAAPVGHEEVVLTENGDDSSGRAKGGIDPQHVLNLPGTPEGSYRKLSEDTADAATSSANSTANLTPKRTQAQAQAAQAQAQAAQAQAQAAQAQAQAQAQAAQAQETPTASPLAIPTPQDGASIREERKSSYIEARAAELGENPLSDLEASHAAQHFAGDDAIVIPRLPGIPAEDKIADVLYVIESMQPESFQRHPRIIAFNYYRGGNAFPVVVNVDTGKFLFSSAAEIEKSVTDAAINKFCEVGAARYLQQALKKFNHEIEIQLQQFVFENYVTEYLGGRAAAIGIACCVEFLRNGKEKADEKRQGIIGEDSGSQRQVATENVNRAVAENEANALSFQDEREGGALMSEPFSPGPLFQVPPSRRMGVIPPPFSPPRNRGSQPQPSASPAAAASSGADTAAPEEAVPELDEVELQRRIIEIAQHLPMVDASASAEELRAKAIISLVAERERRDLFRKWATETGAPKVYSHYHFQEVRDLPVSSLEGDDEANFVGVVREIVYENLNAGNNLQNLAAELVNLVVAKIRDADVAVGARDWQSVSSDDSLTLPATASASIQQALANFQTAELPERDVGLNSVLREEIEFLQQDLQTLADRCEVEANWGGETAIGVAAALYPETVYANDPTRYFQFCGKKIRFREDVVKMEFGDGGEIDYVSSKVEIEVVGDDNKMRVASEEEIEHMSQQALIGVMLQDALGGELLFLKPNCSLSVKGGAANNPDVAQVYEFRKDEKVVATFTRGKNGEFVASIPATAAAAPAQASDLAPAQASANSAISPMQQLVNIQHQLFDEFDNRASNSPQYEKNYFLQISPPERGPIRIIGNKLKSEIGIDPSAEQEKKRKLVLTSENLCLEHDDANPTKFHRMEIGGVVLDDAQGMAAGGRGIISNADISNSTFRNCTLRLDFSQVDPRVLNTVKFVNCTFVECKWPEGFAIKKANLQGGGVQGEGKNRTEEPVAFGSFSVMGANAIRVEKEDRVISPSRSIAWHEEQSRVPSSKFVPASAVQVVNTSRSRRAGGAVATHV